MDKETFLKIIESYLESSYNTAFMINGSWGSGKTYFWKEVIQPHIEYELSENRKKPYKVIYIPLYGSTSIQDIKSKLVSELYILNLKENHVFYKQDKKESNNKNENDDNQTSILNLVTSFIITNESDSLFKKINLQNFDKYEYVLCFDDLERLEENLINECLGFINFLMEHSKIKTFIIANESKIILLDENENNIDEIDSSLEYIKKNNNKLNSNYIENKEKTIGKTFKFSTLSKKDVFKSMVLDTKYLEDTKNFNYFINNTNFIDDFYSLFNSNAESNYRTLFYTLSIIKDIDKYIPINDIDTDLKIEALESIFLFTIGLSFESRKEYLIKLINKYDFYSLFYTKNLEDIESGILRTKKENESDILFTLKDNLASYFFNKKYKRFLSIIDFILKDNIFDYESFQKDVTSFFNSKSNIYIIEQLKNYKSFNDASDVDIVYKEVKKIITKGEIDTLAEYLRISNVLFTLLEKKIIEYINPEEIKNSIIDSVNKAYQQKTLKEWTQLKTYFYEEDLRTFEWKNKKDYIDEKEKIKNHIENIALGIKRDKNALSMEIEYLKSQIEKNILKAIDLISSRFYNIEILTTLGENFIEKILNENNKVICAFNKLIISRYFDDNALLIMEKNILKKYVVIIEKYLEEKASDLDIIKKLNIEELKELIDESLKRINNEEQSNEKDN